MDIYEEFRHLFVSDHYFYWTLSWLGLDRFLFYCESLRDLKSNPDCPPVPNYYGFYPAPQKMEATP